MCNFVYCSNFLLPKTSYIQFMKKTVLIFVLILSSISFFAQQNSQIFDNISCNFSDYLANEILRIQIDIAKKIEGGNTETISIQVDYLYNENGQQTELSKELGYRITNYLEQQLNNVSLKRHNFKVNSPYDFDLPTDEKITLTKQKEYTLTGQYTILNDKINFSKFKITHINSGTVFHFEDKPIDCNSFEILKEYDNTPLQPNFYQQLMDIKKDNVILKSAYLTKNENEENHIFLDGIGQVYQTNFDVDYNLKIELNKNAYVYVFFYDPGDSENNFIWFIAEKNILYKKGIYKDFLLYDMNFYETPESSKYNYMKLIISEEKINIEEYYTQKYIDGYESIILQNQECKQLINNIKTLNNIQTETIILTF